MNRKVIHRLVLEKDGSFTAKLEKVFFVKPYDIIRLTLNSKRFLTQIPILLTNLNLHKKDRSSNLASSEIKNTTKIDKLELEQKYDYFMGTFDAEGAWLCDITFSTPGSYFLQIIFVNPKEFKNPSFTISDFGRPEWIVVEPLLKIDSHVILPRQLIMQTLLSRCLGPLERWEEIINQESSLQYNAFHLTPLQKLGASGSLYSINDQLILSDTFFPSSKNNEANLIALRETLRSFESKYKCGFFTEIILNHTSYDSAWLLDIPNAYYNIENTPQLGSAYALDNALYQFSDKLSRGEIPEYPNPFLRNENDLHCVMQILVNKVIEPLKLHEYFLIDIEKCINEFRDYMQKTYPNLKALEKYIEAEEDIANIFKDEKIFLLEETIQKHIINLGSKPYGVTIDFFQVGEYFKHNITTTSYDQLITCFKKLNLINENTAREHIKEAIDNIRGDIFYNKIQKGIYQVTMYNHLISPYFGILDNGKIAARNGWLFRGDPTEDFASSTNFHYLRRNIVIWGDLVKLNYGKHKSHCPELWKRMKKYVQQMASISHGLRLDNAHSTPIHVAEYFVRKARKINPNLYVFCELFSGSQIRDAEYTKRIGVNALLREAIQVSDCKHLGERIFTYSGGNTVAVGSLDPYYDLNEETNEIIYLLNPRDPDPILYDLTHDNQSYHQKRTIMDSLSTAGLVAMSNCFIASTKGFDQLYPKNPSVVLEKRLYPLDHDALKGTEIKPKASQVNILYTSKQNTDHVEIKGTWDNWQNAIPLSRFSDNIWRTALYIANNTYQYKFIINNNWLCDDDKPKIREGGIENNVLNVKGDYKIHPNIMFSRRQLNTLHKKIAVKYPEFYLNQITDDIITINRENISKTKSYVLISRSAFRYDVSESVNTVIYLPGTIKTYKLIYYMEEKYQMPQEDEKYLRGIEANVISESSLLKFADVYYDSEKHMHYLRFFRMPPSFTCIIKVNLIHEQTLAIQELDAHLSSESLVSLEKCIGFLKPHEINYILFSCESEEKDRTYGQKSVYYLPNYGNLTYAGLGSFFRIIKEVRLNNNLSHPLFNNLREGYWLLDYILARLSDNPIYKEIHKFLDRAFSFIKIIPKHLIPKYFVKTISLIRVLLEKKLCSQKTTCNLFQNTIYFKNLLLSAYQMVANIPSATFHDYPSNMAAGLPHFSTGWARCWGRDTFIAFKGIFLVTGLYQEAKNSILMFASTMRHGLIPNLLDGGNNPRYNCRDAVWWFIRAIGEYVDHTKDYGIFKEQIEMKFLDDNQSKHEKKKANNEKRILSLEKIIHQIFLAHAKGIKYREWNAGDKIDQNMTYHGFTIELELDELTGFIIGGNQYNCLTWMDKMGSSSKAGNKGMPATPRDGAPIELTALLKCCLEHAVKWLEGGYTSFDSVETQKGKTLLLKDWSHLISKNFDKHYWIPADAEHFKDFSINPAKVGRRGIYKDTYMATREVEDYYLRPNGCVAVAVAPELFSSKERVFRYMKQVERWLIKDNSLGIKTLDPKEVHYFPVYNNEDDSDKITFAHGFSYHNGPEWVWLFGMFALAGLKLFEHELTFPSLMSYLTNHRFYLESTDWISLPELTHDNGSNCPYSCSAQAWSIGALLEVIYEAKNTLKH